MVKAGIWRGPKQRLEASPESRLSRGYSVFFLFSDVLERFQWEMHPSVFGSSNCKANRLVRNGSSLIDCLSCRMRGLSGWFNQVSTDGIKKNGWLQWIKMLMLGLH